MTEPTDTLEQRLETVGRVFPHVSAKVVDSQNRMLPLGGRGELCVTGWLLQKGYYKNPEKTDEAMIRDDNGVLWMHTGDEATIDEAGYCRITGRIKDIIIRGEFWFEQAFDNRSTDKTLQVARTSILSRSKSVCWSIHQSVTPRLLGCRIRDMARLWRHFCRYEQGTASYLWTR